jgi:alcohol dehydrogenase (cytochrome c)
MALESCNIEYASPAPFVKGQTYYNTGTKLPPGQHDQKVLLAYSMPEGKLVWRYPQSGRGDSWGGTLTTAGGVVFFADDAGSLEAAEAQTGRALWHFNTGQNIYASPMTYAVGKTQYVTIAAGSDVFCFSLLHY